MLLGGTGMVQPPVTSLTRGSRLSPVSPCPLRAFPRKARLTPGAQICRISSQGLNNRKKCIPNRGNRISKRRG